MADQTTTHMVRSRLAQLDAIRGFAVLGVVLVHCSIVDRVHPGGFAFLGQRGVQLFFVASAFTLFMSAERPRAERHPLAAFAVRRYLRLGPMYYVAFLCTLFVFPTSIQRPATTALQLSFLHGISHVAISTGVPGSWSLANEAMFYMMLPLLYRCIRDFQAAIVWLLVTAPLSVVTSYTLASYYPSLREYFTFLWFPAELPVFLMGIAAFFLWKEKLRPLKDTRRIRSISILFLLPLATVPLMRGYQNINLLPVSLALACLCIAVVLQPWRILVNGATVMLGKVSYSVYLIHFFVLYWILPNVVRTLHLQLSYPLPRDLLLLLHAALVLCLSTALATFSWKFIEQPGIRLGERINALLQRRTLHFHSGIPLKALVNRSDSPDAQI